MPFQTLLNQISKNYKYALLELENKSSNKHKKENEGKGRIGKLEENYTRLKNNESMELKHLEENKMTLQDNKILVMNFFRCNCDKFCHKSIKSCIKKNPKLGDNNCNILDLGKKINHQVYDDLCMIID